MNTTTRRSFLALGGASALTAGRAGATLRPQVRNPLFSCGAAIGTPEIVAVESDITFEEAYIDTTIPYFTSALTLTEAALDDIDDERVLPIARRILETQPQDIELLEDLREEILGDSEPADATHDKMLISMGGKESCTDESHMNFMDQKWVMKTFEENDDPFFAYVSMLVLLMEMEMHQHHVGVELASNHDLHAFCQRQVDEKTPELETLKIVRGELFTRY